MLFVARWLMTREVLAPRNCVGCMGAVDFLAEGFMSAWRTLCRMYVRICVCSTASFEYCCHIYCCRSFILILESCIALYRVPVAREDPPRFQACLAGWTRLLLRPVAAKQVGYMLCTWYMSHVYLLL